MSQEYSSKDLQFQKYKNVLLKEQAGISLKDMEFYKKNYILEKKNAVIDSYLT